MKPNNKFLGQPKHFWAHVRTISQEVGYTERTNKTIKIPTIKDVQSGFISLNLKTDHLFNSKNKLTDFGEVLFDYFEYRADVLNNFVKYSLMNKESAEVEFNKIRSRLDPKCPMPMNKQKAEKRNHAFLTCMVNMLIEENIGNTPCDYDPRSLTTLTHDHMPLRTMSRRVDGAYPAVVNPIAIWEIKEYYYTTTFGSRVADGVYETLLDGMELEELSTVSDNQVRHILFIDDYFTWWECGRSYLCRMIDMLHMGYVDEVIFGKEVIDRLPKLAKEWKKAYESN